MLGSRRLAILDLSSGGHQPMLDEPNGLAVTFNGEIYNYLELAAELAGAGFRFQSRTDTEVLLKSYARWGEGCLAHLNGMFAFAIWDQRRQELFAARDRFGEKPFYYYLEEDRELLAFGSEIKALVAGRLFTPRPDRGAVYSFLMNHGSDSGFETMFEKVMALPMAHALKYSWRKRSLKTWRYWDLEEDRKIRFSNDGQYGRRFLELLGDSVRLRLRSDVRVGSSLSGGLDSSTIVGLVAQSRPEGGQETFSARFSDPALDEGPYIERMAAWAEVKNHPTYPSPKNFLKEIDKLTWQQDEPFYGSSVYAQWCVMRLARDCGVTVLLDGQGGDEVLAGYHSYFSASLIHLFRQFRFLAAANVFRRYASIHGKAQLPLILLGLVPPKLRDSVKNAWRPLAIEKEFERHWRRPAPYPRKKFRHPLHQSLYDTITRGSLPHLLRYADRNSMAFSREIRLPFLDHRLVEYLFAIPAEQKLNGVTTKIVLRNAMSGILPEEIRKRKDKLGYAPPEILWLRGPLREWAEDILLSTPLRQREWVDQRVLGLLWKRFNDGEGALHSQIWRWLSLEVWMRNCLAAKGAAPGRPTIDVLPRTRSVCVS
jgi:asparagine synthase (glutamine-hydrolysing)